MYRQFIAAVVKRPRALDAHRQSLPSACGIPSTARRVPWRSQACCSRNSGEFFSMRSVTIVYTSFYFYSITGMIFSKTVSVYLKSYHTHQELSIFLASCAHLPAIIKKSLEKYSRLQQKSARCSLQRFAHAARVGNGFCDFVIFFSCADQGQRRQRRNIDRALSSENAFRQR